jgi:hypothetical protein
MTLDHMYETVKSLTERINVLEAERVNEKYIRPLYEQRRELLVMIVLAEGVK